MIKRYDSQTAAHQFSSLGELVESLKTAPRHWRTCSSKRNSSSPSWDLNTNYERALQLAATGWEEGVKEIGALAAAVPNERITTREYSIAGESPDVPRYLAGDPFNMVHRGRNRTPKPVLTIAVSIMASCAVKAKDMANYGAAMVALVDRLESRNVRVELLCAVPSDLYKGRSCISWTVKGAGDALDLSAIAFSLAHPAALRRLGFGGMEQLPADWEVSSYGKGTTDRLLASDFVDIPEGALLIGGIGHNPGACKTLQGAIDFATAQIAKAYRAVGYDEPLVELEEY